MGDEIDRKDYNVVRAWAQLQANTTGYDYGVSYNKLSHTWNAFMLPRKQNRYGAELRCEVVMCEDLRKAAVGHGP